jgi:hypothetical protein
MTSPEIGGNPSEEPSVNQAWEDEGTVYFSDPATGLIVHSQDLTLEQARTVKGVRIQLSNGETTDTAHYHGNMHLTRPVQRGEEAIYLGQELEYIGGRNDGAKVQVTGLEYVF